MGFIKKLFCSLFSHSPDTSKPKAVKESREILESREAFGKMKMESSYQCLQKSYPSERGLKINEILMIHLSDMYTADQENFPQFWIYEYGTKSPKSLLTSLIERGYIEAKTAAETLSLLKIPELKDILKEFNLPQTGKKSDLISRIAQNVSEESLFKKISIRGLKPTVLGEAELKDNGYVPYFHKHKQAYGLDIWSMNALLKDYHTKNMWRDRIWGKLHEDLNEAMILMGKGNYSRYIAIKSLMYDFLIEENRDFEIALLCWTESNYYQANYESPLQYKQAIDHYNFVQNAAPDKNDKPPEFSDYIWFDISSLKKIKKGLGITYYDELYEKILLNFKKCIHNKPYMTDDELLNLIKSEIKKG